MKRSLAAIVCLVLFSALTTTSSAQDCGVTASGASV
jgi:hypothetical protein